MEQLSKDDLNLARHLAADLARMGDTSVPAEYDEIQAGQGWTWDQGRTAGRTNWQRISGYQAKNWDGVKVRVADLLADPAYLESL